MFIVYGDPKSSNPPILSARTASGYTQPELLSSPSYSSSSASVRLISSTWQRPTNNSNHSPSTYLASVSFACSRCWEWTGSEIGLMSPDQSWIWAWNEKQIFTEFWDGALLEPHLPGNGGTGKITVSMRMRPAVPVGKPKPETETSMTSSASDFSPPAGNKFVTGSEDRKSSWIMWNFHGFALGFAFLVLFPAGISAISTGSGKAFTYHWILQLVATILMTAGAATGLVLRPSLQNSHQKIGLLIMITIWIQAFLGWRHHVNFLKIFRRTWISLVHVWLGRLLVLGGCTNILIGMSLHGRSRLSIEILFLVMVFELVALSYWVLLPDKPGTGKSVVSRLERLRGQESRFSIGSDDDEESSVPEPEKNNVGKDTVSQR
jgi:hypothetical protein